MIRYIRLVLSDLVRNGLELVVPHLSSPRVIYDRKGESPYLSRWYLLGGPRSKDGFDAKGNPLPAISWSSFPVNLYLHKFHRGDDDAALHSHPWSWAVSFILAGGYSEERRYRKHGFGIGWGVDTQVILPFTFNFISENDYHRVDLLEKDAWSLFLAGPKADTWYFWDRVTNKTTRWKEFILGLRGGAFEET